MSAGLDALEARIGHRFRDRSLLERALTHASFPHENPGGGGDNQRLEFLGDSVLQLVLTEALFSLYPGDDEGALTLRRAVLTGGRFLAAMARGAGIDACMILGANEEASGGRARDAAAEDAFEALVGAVNLDGGIEAARRMILHLYGDIPGRVASLEGHANPKGRLQEIVQPEHGNGAVRYEVTAAEGEDHRKSYLVTVLVNGRRLGDGRGSSKKAAEEEAARAALAALGRPPPAQ
ncbi:MAG TPA: ribonuclease III [Opitutaceae bacterium]|jgi:ribonuclease-3